MYHNKVFHSTLHFPMPAHRAPVMGQATTLRSREVSMSPVRRVVSSCAVAVARRQRTFRVVTCEVAKEASDEPALSAIGKKEVDVVISMVQKNFTNESIDSVLQAMVAMAAAPVVRRNALLNTELEKLRAIERGEKEIERREKEIARREKEIARREEEIARLRGQLNITMAEHLNTQGLLNMRGLMEHIQKTMNTRTKVQWDKTKPIVCWRAYLHERKSLQECLKKKHVSLKDAPDAMAQMYTTLSEAVHDSWSADKYIETNMKLYIGPPLKNSKQRAMMVCLCNDVGVEYTYQR